MRTVERVRSLDCEAYRRELDLLGYARIPTLLSEEECRFVAGLYDAPDTRFRSTITMSRYNFGRGEYKYFDYPLPDIVAQLRGALYPHLAAIANDWARQLGNGEHWPDSLEALLNACHSANQTKPTPLLLRYEEGDYNCLHQDLYGDIHFPFQVIVQLSSKSDFDGGELVLVEQRPRMQSRPAVVALDQGDAVIIPVRDRPVKGARGWRRNQMRHGVSVVTRGSRRTLGLIFHDAK